MHATALILALPRELRDIIYKEYFRCADGYHYNFISRNLRRKDGQGIDLALTLTCTQIAIETRGLALQSNTIHFTTSYSDDTRPKTARLHFLLKKLESYKQRTMRVYCEKHGISQEYLQSICDKFPDFQADLRPASDGLFPRRRNQFPWGQANSWERRFVTEFLGSFRHDPTFRELMSSDHDPFMAKIAGNHKFWEAAVTPNEDNSPPLDIVPWNIPSKQILAAWVDTLPQSYPIDEGVKFRFSAAALAVQFLTNLPAATRLHILRLVLDEKEMAVGYPECHAQGLIPFCQENLKLSIERKVDLWRNIFVRGNPNLPGDFDVLRNAIRAMDVTPSISPWVVEALALPSMGMPANSFRLVLDGSFAPEATTRILQNMHRDAAWQNALEESFRRNLRAKPPLQDWCANYCYIFEGFPKALADIVHGRSIIHCNFDIGELWDVEKVIEAHRDWSLGDWSRRWFRRKIDHYGCPPSLSSFASLVQAYHRAFDEEQESPFR